MCERESFFSGPVLSLSRSLSLSLSLLRFFAFTILAWSAVAGEEPKTTTTTTVAAAVGEDDKEKMAVCWSSSTDQRVAQVLQAVLFAYEYNFNGSMVPMGHSQKEGNAAFQNHFDKKKDVHTAQLSPSMHFSILEKKAGNNH